MCIAGSGDSAMNRHNLGVISPIWGAPYLSDAQFYIFMPTYLSFRKQKFGFMYSIIPIQMWKRKVLTIFYKTKTLPEI